MLKNLKYKTIYEMAENENIDGVPFYMVLNGEYNRGDIFFADSQFRKRMNGKYQILDKYYKDMYIIKKLP